MPASLQEVKRRIESTKKTSQITSAMQMVSTAKLSQIQKHATSYQVYATKIRSVITHLSKSHLLDSVNTTSKKDRKSTRLNSSHVSISYAVFCLKKKKKKITI